MTEQEQINQQLQRQIDMQGRRIDTLAVKVDALSNKIDSYIEESRATRARQDEDMREIRASLNSMGKHVQNLTVAAMVGIGAAVIGIGAIAVSVVYSVFTH